MIPEITRQHLGKVMISSAVVANISDMDGLLHLFGQTLYHFHHRGLTHSFIGLPLVLLGSWLMMKLIWRHSLDTVFTKKQLWIWMIWQNLFCHLLLDYLTAYGVMLFYPLSFQRFSWPIMFNIDPVFWIICGTGLGFIIAFKTSNRIRLTGCLTLMGCLLWWSGLIFYKSKAESLSFPGEQPMSFPSPLAPIGWLVVNQNESSYETTLVSFFHPGKPKVMKQTLADSLYFESLCSALEDQSDAQTAFLNYKQWASHVVCQDDSQESCICHSMRYAFYLSEGTPYFGSVRIHKKGDIAFLPPETREGLRRFRQTFLND